MAPSAADTVRAIASDVLGLPVADITPDTSTDTAPNWDSVQHLNLVLALEQALGLTFEPEELDQMKSIRQIVTLVERKQSQSA